MLLRLRAYELEIKYFLGMSLLVAGTLSRAYLPEVNTDGLEEQEIESLNKVQYLPISQNCHQAINQSTEQDAVLQVVKQIILKGWPLHKGLVSLEIKPFYQLRDDLCTEDGLLFKGGTEPLAGVGPEHATII